MKTYPRFLRDDPGALHLLRTRSPATIKMTGFLSEHQYRASKLYAETYCPVGCDRRLGFVVQDGSPVNLAATLNRQGRDFTEEERARLDLLRPHLLQANALAHADQLAVAARLPREDQVSEAYGVGLIELDRRGGIRC